MNESDLTELKEWLRIDDTDNDITLRALIATSREIIKNATGLLQNDIPQSDADTLVLYVLAQKLIITGLYENRAGTSESPILISIYVQLHAYKQLLDGEISG